MDVGLYRAAQSLSAHRRQLDAIATNIANIGTTGFKRGTTAFHELAEARRTGEARGLRTPKSVDFSQGNLNQTGRRLDLALMGEGFFTVEGPEGELYTRSGELHMSDRGELITIDGLPVAWANRGSAIDPLGAPITFDGDGTARQGKFVLGKIKLTNFQDLAVLERDRAGYWTAPPRADEATVTAIVQQGALEDSNALGIEEMVAMITVQRSYGSITQTMSTIQESYRRLTRPF